MWNAPALDKREKKKPHTLAIATCKHYSAAGYLSNEEVVSDMRNCFLGFSTSFGPNY